MLSQTSSLPSYTPRFMWISPDRLLYSGLLGQPSVRVFGGLGVYIAPVGELQVRIASGPWQQGPVAIVQPYTPHEVAVSGRYVHTLQVEPETIDPSALPLPLQTNGAVTDMAFATGLRNAVTQLACNSPTTQQQAHWTCDDFDKHFFGAGLVPRKVDARIQHIVDTIKRHPETMITGEECARCVHLSFSRFVHLFRQETGASFRSFRAWKRARNLLLHVNRDGKLVDVAMDTGYPDSAHFSNSIRQVFGLKPKDIFAGSRHLTVVANAAEANATALTNR